MFLSGCRVRIICFNAAFRSFQTVVLNIQTSIWENGTAHKLTELLIDPRQSAVVTTTSKKFYLVEFLKYLKSLFISRIASIDRKFINTIHQIALVQKDGTRNGQTNIQ
jgi:hypothetical protein